MPVSNRRRKELRTRRANAQIPQAQKTERMVEVQALLLQGVNRRNIQHELAKRYGVDERTIRGYITDVIAEWKADEKEIDPTQERAKIRAQLDEVYMAARHAKDWRACNQLLRTKLQMLPQGMAPQRVELSGPDGAPVPVAAEVVAKLDLSGATEEELAALESLARKLPAVPLGGGAGEDRG